MQRDTVDVADLIDRGGMGRLQWTAIGLCGLVAIFDGFDNQAIAFVAPLVAHELQVAAADFGPIFGAGLLGLMLGTLIFGPAADRVGRKPIILLSVGMFGCLTLLTPLADSVRSLALLRFLAGVGLGGAMPNVIALSAEYAPKARRATLVTLMFCGIPLGAVLGGLLSARLMVPLGWRSVFYAGGALPLLLLPVLFFLLPESLRYLVARRAPASRIMAILRRLDPSRRYADDTEFAMPARAASGLPVARLFAGGRGTVTVLFWVTFFCNLLLMFFLISWLPLVLRQSGSTLEQAAIATVVLNAGSILGGLMLGRIIDARMSYGLVAVAYAMGAAATAALGVAAYAAPLVFMLNVFVVGVFVPGMQFCMNAIVAGYYPTELRSTGIGWALGIGRTGSVIGPMLGGMLIGLGWGTERLFLAAAVPALCAAASVFLISTRIRPDIERNPAAAAGTRATSIP